MLWHIYFWLMVFFTIGNFTLAISKHGEEKTINAWHHFVATLLWIPAFILMFKAIYG